MNEDWFVANAGNSSEDEFTFWYVPLYITLVVGESIDVSSLFLGRHWV